MLRLSEILRDPDIGRYGEVEYLIEAPLRDIQAHLRRFFSSAQPDDELFLYLTGHGFESELGPAGYFLAAADTDLTRPMTTGLNCGFVRGCLRDSQCLNRVIVLDFCYSGSFMAALELPMEYWQRTLVVTATEVHRELRVAPGWSEGMLTGVVIEGLRTGAADLDGDGIVSGDEFAGYLADHARTAAQEPQVSRGDVVDHLVVAWRPGSSPSRQPAAEAVAVDEVTQDDPPDSDVDWLSDTPADHDLLDRKALATVVRDRLARIAGERPESSFLVHLDGRWGTGKSTLLKFLRERLEPDFLVVEFDAWRQARLAHPWWFLLTAAREAIAGDLGWWRRKKLRIKEIFDRVRRTGAPYVAAVAVLLVLAGAIAMWLWPRQGTSDQWGSAAKVVSAVAGALIPLWAGALVASRFLLWNSARGAKLFEQSGTNPLHEVSAHFSWLLGQTRKPVVFFVDDLDRCPHAQVVDLLDTVQTLFRDAPRRTGAKDVPAPFFVVAADGAWLRKSYELTYETFGDCVALPGKPLGYLFLDKIFQLTVRMPLLTEAKQQHYVDRLLRIGDQDETAVTVETEDLRRRLNEGQGRESEILDLVAEASPAAKAAVAGDAAMALLQPEVVRRTEHEIRKFRPLLGENPRGMKHFFNTYSIFRCVRTLEGNTPSRDTLALWSIVRMRWPSLFDYLEASPDAAAGVLEPILVADHFPATLHDVATSLPVRQVFLSALGGPLTAARIRQCAGHP
ncbi:P-loop NTPase fold protein [Amycolatopsis sp. NPDC051716]|uniref:P-loop NTPase fold protein n=1 Tax=Amycolatopsis sp. NPDC051716 TaxID=3155804 RepID=UPI0034220D4A